MNTLCRSLQTLTTDIVYVMPISGVHPLPCRAGGSGRLTGRRRVGWVCAADNGGSTSEIVRVLGGPAIGDIRSRMVRLADDRSPESRALSELLQYRLPLSADEAALRAEWFQLIDGTHRCVRSATRGRSGSSTGLTACTGGGWGDGPQAVGGRDGALSRDHPRYVPPPDVPRAGAWDTDPHVYACTTAFLLHFNTAVLTRSREFSFANGSIGNFFFTGTALCECVCVGGGALSEWPPSDGPAAAGPGARLFFGSLEAAIFLFSGIARIPRTTEVVPIINLKFDGITLGARLENGAA
jgi:hypothetical protein